MDHLHSLFVETSQESTDIDKSWFNRNAALAIFLPVFGLLTLIICIMIWFCRVVRKQSKRKRELRALIKRPSVINPHYARDMSMEAAAQLPVDEWEFDRKL